MTDKQQLIDQVRAAYESGTAMTIRGGGSKDFLVDAKSHEQNICLEQYRGIISYQPSELTITALAGTPLSDIQHTLRESGQMLAFEPPAFGDSATIGGTIACSLSGPRRPYSGAARDFVLGSKIINGKGEELRFGGEVMKNVAGYDLSRVMVGAYGTLGVLLEVSLKVLPLAKQEQSFATELTYVEAFKQLHKWVAQGQPVSAACFYQDRLHIRLSGAKQSVENALVEMGRAQKINDLDATFWQLLNEQQLDFFQSSKTLWRISLPAAADAIQLPGEQLIDWGGALRWLYTDSNSTEVRAEAERLGGHAQLFRTSANVDNSSNTLRQHPISQGLFKLHQGIKQAMDPKGILNPNYLFPEL